MCGICGFLDPRGGTTRDELSDTVGGMAACVRHRGPDDGGAWVDEEAGVALGHRRLSIVDLSPLGHQPMQSGGGRYVVAFNGEIYNFPALRRELEGRGHRFRGHSDTEVLLAAVEEWGVEAALRRFVGMFAFALWDRAERALFLCRDRMGEKPLYYGWSGGVFLFGSELKALRAHPRWRGEVDRDALALYLRHVYVPGPYSIYRGIRKLQPGNFLRVTADETAPAEPTEYWSLREAAAAGAADPFTGSDAEAVDALDARLRDAVAQQMVADVPLGAFLSGGIDSSTVVALMQAQSATPVRTFSIGVHDRDYDEAEHARAVAAHLGTDHTELYVTSEDALGVIPRLATMYDEPFADSSQIPTFLVAQMARRDVTVSLSGDGGDELFGGYNRYFVGRRVWNRVRGVPRPLRRAMAGGLAAVPPRGWDALNGVLPARLRQPQLGNRLHKLGHVLAAGRPEAIYERLVSEWTSPNDVVRGGREPLTQVTDPARRAPRDDFTERMMYLDALTYLPDDILVKVDRAAMAVSLETRVPFLDHRVVELAWRLPLGMKVRGTQGKWILRQVLDRYVPRELIERPKMGFGIPIQSWLRGPLRDWAEALLDERRLRDEGFFHPAPIRARWREHLAGSAEWQHSLWSVLMFQAWREHAEGAGPERAARVPAMAAARA